MKGISMPVTNRRIGLVAGLVTLTVLMAACGGDEGGPAAEVSARPPQAQITITEADVTTPVQLQEGRYRFGWDAPECAGVDFAFTGQAQGFSYAKKSALPKFQSIMSDVPSDTYTLSQSDARCTTWTVKIDRIGS
ncbi:MAG TPA: hypothetical protein VD763_10875 [Candidatus Saccharimonadales bacterium]|nr:hypothetical protein [Candidatus Saccharimonadales bacterium]